MLTGARQTGKTSSLVPLFPKDAFISLGLPSEARQAERMRKVWGSGCHHGTVELELPLHPN
jgi:hypothetical protein